MAWTDIARAEHNRDRLRFPSDLTDREWAVVAPMIPAPRRGGRPRTTDMRDVVEAILFIASSGCPWRMLPGDFPPVSTVRGYFYAWRDSGLLATINELLVMAAREIEGKQAQPTAGIIDSQSVKTTESGGISGYDAGKTATNCVCAEIKGRKRHIITDTLGFLIFVRVHGADIQDRDGAPDLLRAILFRHPWLRHIFADGGYAKPPFGAPQHVLAYLGRYTHRVAIANSRLVSLDDDAVAFRWRDYRHGNAARLMTLHPAEFIRRFLLHALPDGFPRIRHFGFLANGHRHSRLVLIRQAIAASASMAMNNQDADVPGAARPARLAFDPSLCPCCGGAMRVIATFPRCRPCPDTS